ncbi:putative immunity protein [Propionicimonas sp.]|uniref:putative immunity protein n=1 Tax=Propionicimonas sp. TaxID=1955623 RepID=UPI001831E829|nr:hypothetical protein [Propionicimonas sp.]MBU3978002.1 hypothetical protein [Actinomycetota bacterium]MBA3021776.1 hypothetical protein [Propionicimonas sp.]MBU3985446.1 hypothetical protein [Actinomycetota bacterium]MBU4007541.1 hypothetical protein [Actinomycetota bacterium]MBU4066565.1 hypothetical protein [Actinomycetota bacterium]
MSSAQTLSEADRRVLARWAAVCAEHALPLFNSDDSTADLIVRDALARAAAFARGESTAAAEIRLRMAAVKAASSASTPAGAAAARSVAQAAAVAHLAAHALGAAAYAVKAVTLARPDHPGAAGEELAWQLAQLTDVERLALQQLPLLGTDPNGPLGSGLLTNGILGETVRAIQQAIAR